MEAMNPQQQLPPDYLDQIAPRAARRSFSLSRKPLLILIGIVAVVFVIILSVVMGQIGAARTEPWERLAARIAATSEIATSSEGKIKNSALRSTNSNVKLSLVNTQRDLAAPLVAIGIDSEKLPVSITSAESTAAMLTRLEDARLNAKYDSTYAREMSFQLANLLTLLRQLYGSSKNADNKAFLNTTYKNFEPVQKSLAEFSASNE